MSRRDGREAQLPLMPWKGGLKHDWQLGGMQFGGGESCEWTCKNCGMEYTFVFWEVDTKEEVEAQEWEFKKFQRGIPEYGCSGKFGVLANGTPFEQVFPNPEKVERWD